MRARILVTLSSLAVFAMTMGTVVSRPAAAPAADEPITVDHCVRVKSMVPSIAGQTTQVYVRERALTSTVLRSPSIAASIVKLGYARP